jgi:hypothetical protein
MLWAALWAYALVLMWVGLGLFSGWASFPYLIIVLSQVVPFRYFPLVFGVNFYKVTILLVQVEFS